MLKSHIRPFQNRHWEAKLGKPKALHSIDSRWSTYSKFLNWKLENALILEMLGLVGLIEMKGE